MLKIFLIILMSLLSAIGVCDILHSLWQMLLLPKNKPLCLHITFLDGNNDDSVLQWLSDHVKWYGRKFAERYLVVADYDIKTYETYKDIPIDFINSKDFSEIGDFYEQYRIKRNG